MDHGRVNHDGVLEEVMNIGEPNGVIVVEPVEEFPPVEVPEPEPEKEPVPA
jgi:hypothetical protein